MAKRSRSLQELTWKTTLRKDEGCQIIDPTPELEKAMRSAAEKVWQDESCTSTFDQDAVDRILKDAGLK